MGRTQPTRPAPHLILLCVSPGCKPGGLGLRLLGCGEQAAVEGPSPRRAAEPAHGAGHWWGAYRAGVRAAWQVLELGPAKIHGLSLKGMKANVDIAWDGGGISQLWFGEEAGEKGCQEGVLCRRTCQAESHEPSDYIPALLMWG